MPQSLILVAAATLLAGTAAGAQDGDPATLAERNTEAALQRIEALNPRVNAVIAIDPTAMDQARALDRMRRARGPLFGMPILIKDNIETDGPLPTTAGSLALAANVASVVILMAYKDGDANVRSVWICSRNDAIGNVAVMIAALGVWGTMTGWPDLIVAAILGGLFFTSSIKIVRHAWAEYRHGDLHDHEHQHAH